uniref:Uncharacterized protein n=1 Tax=Meloidogyne incognita TaxID=6306 RepID=A0A914MPX3_MELIC
MPFIKTRGWTCTSAFIFWIFSPITVLACYITPFFCVIATKSIALSSRFWPFNSSFSTISI